MTSLVFPSEVSCLSFVYEPMWTSNSYCAIMLVAGVFYGENASFLCKEVTRKKSKSGAIIKYQRRFVALQMVNQH